MFVFPSFHSRRRRRTCVLIAGTLAAVLIGGGAATAYANSSSDQPIHPTIIGGHDSTRPYPSTASLETPLHGDPDFHFCGATVVADFWAVTNAHCVTDFDGSPLGIPLHLRVGSADRTSGGTVVQVAAVLPHASWDWGTGTNMVADIAMLRLADRVPGRHIDIPIRLGHPMTPTVIVGWGLTSDDATTAPIMLQELTTHLLPPAACTNTVVNISVGEICVNNPNQRAGACRGDSGSAAMQKATTGHYQLIGSTSRSTGDTCTDRPTISTNLVYFQPWIRTVMRTGKVPAPARGQEPIRPQLAANTLAPVWDLPGGWNLTGAPARS